MSTKRSSSAPAENDAKKQQLGNCKCSSCDVWSKDSVPWGKVKRVNGQELPLGDACDACLALYHTAFSHLSWDTFCDKDLPEIQKGKKEAKQLLHDASGKRPWALGVESNTRLSFDVSKDFLVATDADLRKVTKTRTLNKKVMSGIPQIRVGNEDYYIFADPDQTFKKGTLKISSDTVLKEHFLKQQDVFWGGQASTVFESKQDQGDNSLRSLLTSQLMTPNEFLVKRFGASLVPSEQSPSGTGAGATTSLGSSPDVISNLSSSFAGVVADDGDEANDDDDEQPVLGLAAARAAASRPSLAPNAFTQLMSGSKAAAPAPRTRVPKAASIQRGNSGEASDLASCWGGSMGGSSSRSRNGMPEIEGETWLDEWKRKAPIAGLLSGEINGRQVNGIQGRLKELAKLDYIHPDVPALENYHLAANAAWKLASEKDFMQMKEETLQQYLELVEAEGAELPTEVKYKVVGRKSFHLNEQKKFNKLIDVVLPFGKAKWSSSSPCLAAVDTKFEEKYMTFKRALFSKHFEGLIKEGQSYAEQLIELCQIIADKMYSIDNVDLDFAETQAKGEVLVVCNSIISILSDTVDTSCLDDVQKFKASVGKSSTALLPSISSYASRSQFFMTKLDNYLKDCEGMLKYGDEIKDAEKFIPSATLSVESLSKLEGYMGSVPQWRDALRPVVVAPLESGLLKKLVELSSLVETAEVGLAESKALMKCLTEACIVWPMEVQLASSKEQVGLCMGKASMKQSLQSIVSHCGDIEKYLDPSGSGDTEVWAALEGLSELPKIGFPPNLLQEASTEAFQKAESNILASFLSSISGLGLDVSYDHKQFETYQSALQVLASAKSADLSDLITLLEVLIKHHDATAARKASPSELEEKAALEKKAGLSVINSMRQAKHPLIKIIQPAVVKIVETHDADLQKVTIQLKDGSIDALKAVLEEFKDVVVKGDLFYGQKKQSIEKTMKNAEENVLVWEPAYCENAGAKLQQAMSRAEELCALQKVEVPSDVKELVQKTLKYLSILPATGKCAHKIIKHPGDAKKCFEGAQALIKELRRLYGKESEKKILPEVFLKRVNACLSVSDK